MSKSIIVVLLIAAFLRFYKLDSYPVSISWDEAAIGYNAYSIAQTGKDEYGQKFPVLFRSFNDYKLPGYIYLDALLIKIFGLSSFTTRMPSALMGVFAILAIYLLVKNLFNQKVAAIASFFLAISPWHLQFSRAAFESNGALTIVLYGIVLLLLGLRNKIWAFLSIPILAASLYFYYSPRIFIPLILAAFIIIFRKEIIPNFKFFAFGFLAAAVISIPIVTRVLSFEGQKRVREVSVFADPSLAKIYADTRLKNELPLENIFLNQRIPYAIEVLKNYSTYFSPTFLFFAHDPNPRHRSFNQGNFYLFEIVTILLGAFLLMRQKETKSKFFLLAWLLAAPIPASFAKDSPHALRALLMLPALVIISAIGAKSLLNVNMTRLIALPIVLITFIFYAISYYILYPRQDSQSWAFGHRQLYSKLSQLEKTADTVIVSGYYWKPYIFYLYYNKIDPALYQKEENQQKIGKYKFGIAGWDGGQDLNGQILESQKNKETLVAISPREYQALENKSRLKILETIGDYSGGNAVFLIGVWQ